MGDPKEREAEPFYFADRFWSQGKPTAAKTATAAPKAGEFSDKSPEAERHRRDVQRNGPPIMSGLF
jgi:hypothetical protein